MKTFDIGLVLGRMVADTVATFLALVFAWFIRMQWYDTIFFSWLHLGAPATLYPLQEFYFLAVKVTLVLLLILALSGRYQFDSDQKLSEEWGKFVVNYSIGFLAVGMLFYFSQLFFFSRAVFGMGWVMGLLIALWGRGMIRLFAQNLYKFGVGRRRILVLGTQEVAHEMLHFLESNPQYEVVGVLSENKTKQKTILGLNILGQFNDFEKVLVEQEVDEVLLASDNSTESLNTHLVKLAHIHHVTFRFLPDELGLDLAAVKVSTLGASPMITLLHTKITGWGSIAKSAIDHLVSFVALLLLSPVLVLCSVAVFIQNPKASVIYKSNRVGKNGREFFCLKFRSMVPEAEAKKKELTQKNQRKGVFFKIENDPRITSVGRFLRKWSLDELPQLFNVLKGDMSLIGPRPHLPEEVKKYNKDDLRVLSVRPGITGFAQINGRSSLTYEQEMKYELFYLKNWSLWLDFIIALKSIWVVLRRENIDVK